MIVQMVLQVSGGRADGREWPPPWVDLEVPDAEGEDLVRGGLARRVEHREVPPSPRQPEPEPVTVYAPEPGDPGTPEAAPVPEPSPAAAGPAPAQEVPAPEPDKGADEIPVPKPADSKQAWIDYAVSQGTSPEQANDLTKAQLMQVYGGRL